MTKSAFREKLSFERHYSNLTYYETVEALRNGWRLTVSIHPTKEGSFVGAVWKGSYGRGIHIYDLGRLIADGIVKPVQYDLSDEGVEYAKSRGI